MVPSLLRRITLFVALLALLGLAIMPVGAQCTPDTTVGNVTYTCDSDDLDGLDVGSGSDTVNVGASVTLGSGAGPDGSIYSSGGTVWLVVLAGETLNTGDHALLIDGNGNIIAEGVINADSHGFYIRDGNGNITFGELDSDSHLSVDDVAMWVEGEGNITNYGEVDAGTAGLFVGRFDSLIDGVDLSSTAGINDLLDPSGINAGVITNYGDVDGGLVGIGMIGTGTIDNQGVVEGDIASVIAVGTDVVINNGSGDNTLATIEEGALGILGYGSGTVNNYGTTHADGVGMVFISQVQLGEGSLEQIQNAGSELEFFLSIADLVNNMEFVGEWTVNNDGVIEAPVGVLMLGNGTVNNSGTINAPLLGIGAYGNVDINNSGIIRGGLVGAALIGQINIDTEFIGDLFTVPADPNSISDLGALFTIAAALNAIDFDGGGTITNSGEISDVMIGALQLGNGNVVNTETGIVDAALLGLGLYGNGNVVNHGDIFTDGVGMLFIGDISFDDELFFDIESASMLLSDGDLFGPINFGTGTLTNTGTIDAGFAGIAAIGNVTINNSGEITSGLAGIAGIGPNVTINNTGTIANSALGIIAAGDSVTVNNAGTIEETGIGVMLLGDGTVNLMDNSLTQGEMVAVAGIGGNQTVNVDGEVNVISATVAIALEDGEDRVNLRSGANVTGDIDMGDDDDTVQISSGARVDGLIDGGDHINGDTLIVGNEVICGEASGSHQRFFGTRDLVESINLSGDTFTFDGQSYDITNFELGRSGVQQVRCYPFIEDGRINPYDHGASVAGYCNVLDGLNGWAIDAQGNGQADFSVSGEQMQTALQQAVTSGQNVNIVTGARGTSLWALASNQYQLMSDGYAYIFEPGRCGPGAMLP